MRGLIPSDNAATASITLVSGHVSPVKSAQRLPVKKIRNTTVSPSARQPAAVLPAALIKWLNHQPVERNRHGKASNASVAQIIINNQQLLQAHHAKWRSVAEHYQVAENSLYSSIYELKKNLTQKCTLSGEQRAWLTGSLQEYGLNGDIRLTPLAKYYSNKKKQLDSKGISRDQLAIFSHLNTQSLRKRIGEQKRKALRLTASSNHEVCCWLKEHGLKLKEKQKATSRQLAIFYLKNIKTIKNKKIRIKDLCDYYQIEYERLYPMINKLKVQYYPCELDANKEAWLAANGPEKVPNEPGNLPQIAKFYIDNKLRIRSQGITLSNLATYYQLLLPSLVLSGVRYSKYHNTMPAVSAAEEMWLRGALCHPADAPGNSLTELYQQDSRRFKRELQRYQKVQQLPAGPLSAAAEQFLRQLALPEKKTVLAIARSYLQNLPQFIDLQINHAAVVNYFGLKAPSFDSQIRKQSSAWRRQRSALNSAVIKPEPVSDSEGEAELWYKSQLFQKIPLLLSRHDEELVLRHAQGPIREQLANIDATKAKITHSPEFPQLLSDRKLRSAANTRLRELINAACDGALQTLINDEGYYHLMIDEQHPELGMGLCASREIPEGFLLGIYPGVLYSSNAEFQQAARNTDSSFPTYAFQNSTRRPRRKNDNIRKKALRVHSAIGGHLQTWPLVFANTGAVSVDGRVVNSEYNNLAAVMAGKEIIAYVARRKIHAGEPLLINYGNKYRIAVHQPIKQEPEEPIWSE